MQLALLATLLAPVGATAAQPSTIVIRKHQAGPVSLGASAQAIYAAFRGRSRFIDLALEGQLSPALELTFPETRAAVALPECRVHSTLSAIIGSTFIARRAGK